MGNSNSSCNYKAENSADGVVNLTNYGSRVVAAPQQPPPLRSNSIPSGGEGASRYRSGSGSSNPEMASQFGDWVRIKNARSQGQGLGAQQQQQNPRLDSNSRHSSTLDLDKSINELSDMLSRAEEDSDDESEGQENKASGCVDVDDDSGAVGGAQWKGRSINCAGRRLRIFSNSDILSLSLVGQGGFGKVFRGTLQGNNVTRSLPVAVKVFNSPPPEEKGLEQIAKLIRLKHRNLVPILGVVHDEPQIEGTFVEPRILLQFFPEGNLLQFFGKHDHPSDYAMLGKLALDIANGCEYLHSRNIIHGSLAARNILIQRCVSKHKTHFNAKISDYGIAQLALTTPGNRESRTIARLLNMKIVPPRWLPKEVLEQDAVPSSFTKASDVWSYGILLWEMWSKGSVPYGSFTDTEAIQLILKGKNPVLLNRPVGCPEHIVKVMVNIFEVNPGSRPTITKVRDEFSSFKAYGLEKRLKNGEEGKAPEGKPKAAEETKKEILKPIPDQKKNEKEAAQAGQADVKPKKDVEKPKGPKGKAPVPPSSQGGGGNFNHQQKQCKPPKRIQGNMNRYHGPPPNRNMHGHGHGHGPRGPPPPGNMNAGYGGAASAAAPPPYTPAPLPSHYQVNVPHHSHPAPGPAGDIESEIQRKEQELKTLKSQKLQVEFFETQMKMQEIVNQMASTSIAPSSGGPPPPLMSMPQGHVPGAMGGVGGNNSGGQYQFPPPPPPYHGGNGGGQGQGQHRDSRPANKHRGGRGRRGKGQSQGRNPESGNTGGKA